MNDLPPGWEMVTLGEVVDTALGKMLDRGKPKGHSTVPYLRNVNVQWGRIDTHDLLQMELADSERERFEVRAGDLLVCEGGEVGRAAIWQGRNEYLAYQKALHRIRTSSRIHVGYLRYLLEYLSLNGTLAHYSTGSTIAHLSQQKLRSLTIPAPPVAVQLEIVEIIEDYFSRLDAADRSLLRVEQASRDLVALKAQSVYGGTESTAHISAESRTLGEISTLVTDGDHNPPRRTSSGVPHVTAKGIRNGRVSLTGCTYISEEGFAQTSRRYLPLPGDVIVTCVGTIGRTAVVPGNLRFSADRNLAAIRVRSETIIPEFLEMCLNSVKMQRYLGQASGSTAQPHLYLKDLRAAIIPVPSLTVQRELVAEMLWLRDSSERQLLAAITARKRGQLLRRATLEAAFSGRLMKRNSNVDRIQEIASV